MVTLDGLEALDHLIWLRTGARAAEALGCNQSTISRHAARCQKVFAIRLVRRAAEWQVRGETTLLHAERRLHQNYRWEAGLPLRLDAQHWLRDLYGSCQLPGWKTGNMNYLEYERPRELLKQHIIDAWLCCAPDIPDDPELTCVQLSEMPMQLLVKQGHPLLRRTAPLTIVEASAYPLLPLPQGAFPVFEAKLASLGWNQPAAAARQRCAEQPEGETLPIEDLHLGIASPLTRSLYGPDYRILPLTLPISFGDVLVVRSEFAQHPRYQELLVSLLDHLSAQVADAAAEVRVLTAERFEALPLVAARA